MARRTKVASFSVENKKKQNTESDSITPLKYYVQKRFGKSFNIRVVPFKRRLEKAANIRQVRRFWKLAKVVTMQRLQPLQNCQFGSKIKIAENMRKTALLKHITGVLCKKKKRLERTANIRKMTRF